MLSGISSILTPSHATELRRVLPETDVLEGFECCYSSDSHGFSLDALYTMTSNCYPCIVIIQGVPISLSPTKSVIPVVGFYSAQRISPVSSSIQGDSRCFCFRFSDLEVNESGSGSGSDTTGGTTGGSSWEKEESSGIGSTCINRIFKSVSVPMSVPVPTQVDTDVDTDTCTDTHPTDPIPTPTMSQYYHSNKNYLSVGDSSRYNTSAIQLNEDLSVCTSGPSDTYNNDKTLIPEAVTCHISNTRVGIESKISIAKVEVLCGKYAAQKQRNSNSNGNDNGTRR